MSQPRPRSGPPPQRRLFIAAPLPPTAIDVVAGRCREALAAAAAAEHLRMVRPDGYHITVHFFGRMPDDQIEPLRQVLAQIAVSAPAVGCTVTGFGQLPRRGRARVLVAELGTGRDQLSQLITVAREVVAAAGLPIDTRVPLPHVTVARARHQPLPDLRTDPWPAPVAFDIDRLVLFESHLRRDGARYEAHATALLDGAVSEYSALPRHQQ